MQRWLIIICVLLSLASRCALAAEPSAAQTPAAETAAEAEAPATAAAAEDTETTDSRPAAARNDDFVPTVQISEDLSVSFPVDI